MHAIILAVLAPQPVQPSGAKLSAKAAVSYLYEAAAAASGDVGWKGE